MPSARTSNLRIVYILELNRSGELECSARSTTLMKWDAFSAAPIPFEGLFSKRFEPSLTDADRKIALRLRMNTKRNDRDIAVLSGAEGYALLDTILTTGRAFWAKGSRLRLNWDEAPMPVRLDWRIALDEYRPTLLPADPAAVILPVSPPLHVMPAQNICGPVSGDVCNAVLARWAETKPMNADRARTFCLRLLNEFPGQTFPVPDTVKIEEASTASLVPELTLSRRADASTRTSDATSLNELVLVELRFRYGKRLIETDSELDPVSYSEGDTLIRVPRDRTAEKACLQQLQSLGFEPAPTQSTGELLSLDAGGYLLTQNAPTTWEELLDQVFPNLEAKGWKIKHAYGFRLSSMGDTAFYSEAKPEHSWFAYSAGVSYKGMRLSVIEPIRSFIATSESRDLTGMLRELAKRSLAIPLEDGEFLVLPGKLLKNVLQEIFELLSPCESSGSIRLSPWRAAELQASGLLERETTDLPSTTSLPKIDVLLKRLKGGLTLTPVEPPASLQAELRDYQKVGLGWLDFLRETGTHGILADDMGLGKTLQTIALLLAEKEADRLAAPCLIVAPTSVLDNWQSEIARFAPSLSTQLYHGDARSEQLHDLPDILITTFTVLRNDLAHLEPIHWHYLIVDEAQFIKNPSSLAARSLCQLSATHKLCLTGTPIENRLSELWSLFHFLMPDFLGSQRLFRQTYAREIESGSKDGQALAAQLKKRLRPFLLRRTKEHVAKELPAKTEIIRPLELLPDQAERYEAVRTAMNAKVVEELTARGFASSRFFVLDALLKLRQICCDPRLYTKDLNSACPYGSAKLDAAIELIESLLENGHRILLFSQFTTMLALIETELKKRAINHRTLTGATTRRGELVNAFQAGEFPVFLISLKAGGTGLNLTAADAVIHYDPWWNPAAEAQATDRSHRIGQDKPVFVYKLIAENTVEAKILELQKKKGRLAATLLDDTPETSQSTDAALSEKEILGLFDV
jgi:superfamily II DNA or RNA helicase